MNTNKSGTEYMRKLPNERLTQHIANLECLVTLDLAAPDQVTLKKLLNEARNELDSRDEAARAEQHIKAQRDL